MAHLATAALVSVFLAAAGSPATRKGDALAEWHPLWTRAPDAGSAAIDTLVQRPGSRAASIRVEHRGQRDWSLTRRSRVEVREGDVFEISAWVKVRGEGVGQISVVTYDRKGSAV